MALFRGTASVARTEEWNGEEVQNVAGDEDESGSCVGLRAMLWLGLLARTKVLSVLILAGKFDDEYCCAVLEGNNGAAVDLDACSVGRSEVGFIAML